MLTACHTTGGRITRLCIDEAYWVHSFFPSFYSIGTELTLLLKSGLTWRGCEHRTRASLAHSDPGLLLARIPLPRLLNLSKRDGLRSTMERKAVRIMVSRMRIE
jgi:hypothetical protein